MTTRTERGLMLAGGLLGLFFSPFVMAYTAYNMHALKLDQGSLSTGWRVFWAIAGFLIGCVPMLGQVIGATAGIYVAKQVCEGFNLTAPAATAAAQSAKRLPFVPSVNPQGKPSASSVRPTSSHQPPPPLPPSVSRRGRVVVNALGGHNG